MTSAHNTIVHEVHQHSFDNVEMLIRKLGLVEKWRPESDSSNYEWRTYSWVPTVVSVNTLMEAGLLKRTEFIMARGQDSDDTDFEQLRKLESDIMALCGIPFYQGGWDEAGFPEDEVGDYIVCWNITAAYDLRLIHRKEDDSVPGELVIAITRR
jgi:hypothetical protein